MMLAQAIAGRGCGGAVHVDSGGLTSRDGLLEGNSGMMMSGGRDVSGGGLCVNDQAEVTFINITMRSNMAGGSGFYESVFGYLAISEQNRALRAAHVDCAGKLAMQKCSIFDETRAASGGLAWLAGRNFGMLSLVDTQLSSATEDTIALVLNAHSEALLRNCSATNISIKNDGAEESQLNLGIVHSKFDPALAMTVPTIGVSACARSVANLGPMCDPRARCSLERSGGVRCRCSDVGLREKDESRGDGSVCERQASITSQLVTPEIRLAVKKPGNSSSVVLQLTAAGESAAFTTLRVNTSLLSGREGSRFSMSTLNSSGTEAFGSLITWEQPAPASTADFDLDYTKGKYVDTKRHQFTIALNCSAATAHCPADGDTIETVLETTLSLHGPFGESILTYARTTSVVSVVVVSLASCENTRALLSPDVYDLPESAPLRVQVLANDIDDLEIAYSRPEIEVSWADETLGYVRNTGTGRFIYDVPERLVVAGTYAMRILLKNGWNRTMGRQSDCVILLRTIVVTADTTQRKIGFGLAGAVVLMLSAMAALLYRNRHRAQDFLIAFISFEGLVCFELCLEIWERCLAFAPRTYSWLCP
jgi:hypothetical protein